MTLFCSGGSFAGAIVCLEALESSGGLGSLGVIGGCRSIYVKDVDEK